MTGSSFRVIALSGELDIGRRQELDRDLRIAGDELGVLIDAAEVSYADSTALSALLNFRSEAEKAGIPVAILLGSKQFERLIAYAGLGELFRLFDDRAAALTYLSNAGTKR